MAKQDYYSTLGVAKDADLETLKKAYRKLAMQYHPDRNHGDAAAEQKFKELSDAYDVLKDDQKRAAYDRFGHAAFENGNGRGGPAGFDFTASGFADIFDERVPLNAYEVRLAGRRMQWVERGPGTTVVHDDEPRTGRWKRLAVALLSVLPIEPLL